MLALRQYSLVGSVALLSLAACDRSQPVGPFLEAAATGTAGPTVKPPSIANAVVTSESRIDLSWLDNSANETGFEVWRSATGPDGTFAQVAGTGANVTSYGDGGLKPLTQYCYRVRAVRTYDGKTSYSAFSNTTCATTPAPPAPNAPSATNAVPSNSNTVVVTWTDNSANEDGFRVERSPDGGTSWAPVSTTSANVTSLTDGGRSSEQQVCYHVIAFNAGGDSPPSNTACTTPPAAPTGLTATGVDGPAIALAWTDKSAVEDGYEVQRSTDGATFSHLANLPANSTSYRDAAVASNTTYWYRVRAKKDGGSSDVSNSASAATASAPPATPSGTDAYPDGSTAVTIVWTDQSMNEDGFRVERSTDGGTSWNAAGTTGMSASWFTDVGRASEQRVCYRVVAFNTRGDSPPSNMDCATPAAAPSDLTATSIDAQTTDLVWTDNSAVEDSYEVWAMDAFEPAYQIATLPANSTSLHGTVVCDGSWCWGFAVVARKDGGYSDWVQVFTQPIGGVN